MADSLFSELKRRNVFKVGVAYLVLAWVVVQVTQAAVPALHLPEWVNSLVFYLGAIGFPFALFFAWAFEMTAEGIKKESEIAPEDSITSHTSRKLDFVIIALLVIALGYFVYESRFSNPSITEIQDEQLASSTEHKGSSIAVLPFVNMSSDPEQEYFSDGISEELLNLLAKIPNLQVTSRSSAFAFKGKDINISEVAKVLGVKNVLEGSVRKSGTQIRITAQLINAETDKHLWSETYDRKLDDIFKVQDEISAAIVESLKETLGIELVRTSSTSTSINPEAYDLYLQGLTNKRKGTFDSLELAVAEFEAALKIEPDFLLAQIRLAEAFTVQIAVGSRFDNEILDVAEAMLKKVLVNDPNSSLAYLALYNITFRRVQPELGIQYIKQAYRLNPNQVEAVMLYANEVGFELGEEKTAALFKRAKQMDPLNSSTRFEHAHYHQFRLQKYAEAAAMYKEVIKLDENDGSAPFFLSRLYSNNRGNLTDAIELLYVNQAIDPFDPDAPLFLSGHFLSLGETQKAFKFAEQALALNSNNAASIDVKVNALIYSGEHDQALKLIIETLENTDTVYRSTRVRKNKLISKAVYLLLKSENLDQAEQLTIKYLPETVSLIDAAEPQTTEEVRDIRGVTTLSTIYRIQGDENKANKLASRLNLLNEAYFSKRQNRLMSRQYIELALISAAQGKVEKVLNNLEAAVDNGYLQNWRSNIIYAPEFLSIQDHPRFIALIKRLETEMVKQKAILEKE